MDEKIVETEIKDVKNHKKLILILFTTVISVIVLLILIWTYIAIYSD